MYMYIPVTGTLRRVSSVYFGHMPAASSCVDPFHWLMKLKKASVRRTLQVDYRLEFGVKEYFVEVLLCGDEKQIVFGCRCWSHELSVFQMCH